MLIHGNGYNRISKVKLFLASFLFFIKFTSFITYFMRVINRRGIRFVNYHDFHTSDISNFSSQLDYLSKFYHLLNPNQIESFFNGDFNTNKNGLIITFDDGLSSQFNYAYPILKKRGIEPIFFIPPDFINSAESKQSKSFADKHQIEYYLNSNTEIAMSWEQVKEIAFVGSHTMSHCRMLESISLSDIQYEMSQSKKILEEFTNKKIHDFCWVGGELNTYSKQAFQVAVNSGYDNLYTSNNSIHTKTSSSKFINRNNLEACYPISLTAFQTCGLTDFLYFKKRKSVYKKLHDIK
jgi:peptidoglycan/xylan/chitin deacetylase (PgdA/CDA1 family)